MVQTMSKGIYPLERTTYNGMRQVPTLYYDVDEGVLVLPQGTQMKVQGSIGEVLDFSAYYVLGDRLVLYLCVGREKHDKPDRAYFTEHTSTWVLAHFAYEALVAKYTRQERSIIVYNTYKGFNDHRVSTDIYKASKTLERLLAKEFDVPSFHLQETPSHTARDLLECSLPYRYAMRQGKRVDTNVYYRLPDNMLRLLHDNVGYQGRIEHFTQHRRELEALYLLDGRWMYAACLSHLPVGDYVHDSINEPCMYTKEGVQGTIYKPTYPAFYRVEVRVPDRWCHIGLLQAKEKREHFNDEQKYPNKQGDTFENWCTSDELALLMTHNWNVRIIERVLFPHTNEYTDPFSTWLKKLVGLRLQLEQEYKRTRDVTYKLMSDYIRSMVLQLIGSFHRIYTIKEHTCKYGEFDKASQGMKLHTHHGKKVWHVKGEGNLQHFEEELALPDYIQKWVHPEWCSIIWGRGRARLAQFALRLPYEDIVSFYVDCVYSASYPSWVSQEDDGKNGKFRLKGEDSIIHNFVWPDSWANMQEAILAMKER